MKRADHVINMMLDDDEFQELYKTKQRYGFSWKGLLLYLHDKYSKI